MKKPNFLLVGAPKAGTTSIAQYLKEHPDIFIPEEKEPFYFLPGILKNVPREDLMYEVIERKAHFTPESYYGLFEGVAGEKAIGEATVHYLYHYNEVIPKVKSELGDVRIIIVLRNPIERAFSNYKFQINSNLCSFERSLTLEAERKKKGFNSFWFYKEQGLYFEPVKNYLENFTNVHIAFFEDLITDPLCFMQEMYAFLDVDDCFMPDLSVTYNPTLVPRSYFMRIVFYLKKRYGIRFHASKSMKEWAKSNKVTKSNDGVKPKTVSRLKEYYRGDVILLERLLNKDLSSWYI